MLRENASQNKNSKSVLIMRKKPSVKIIQKIWKEI